MEVGDSGTVDDGRRRVLKTLASGAIALTSSALHASETLGETVANSGAGMLRRPVPSSGDSIAAVGLGTYESFDVVDAASSGLEPVLARFVALGGELVDSSPMYGHAEAVIGELAARLGVRHRLFLATKVWTRGHAEGVRQMETSFSRLRTKRLELMQVHNLVDWRVHLPTLRDWRNQGRIRYIGVTHYHASAYREVEAVLRTEKPDFLQINYSMAEREAEARLLPLAQDLGIAVIVNRPFAKASLFSQVRGQPLPAWAAEFDCASWAQFFLKFILAQAAVSCVIPATSKPQHLEDNLAAGRGRLPDARQRARMAETLART